MLLSGCSSIYLFSNIQSNIFASIAQDSIAEEPMHYVTKTEFMQLTCCCHLKGKWFREWLYLNECFQLIPAVRTEGMEESYTLYACK